MNLLIGIMINAGIALMLVNIIGYIRYERYVRKQGIWGSNPEVLYIPIVLLVMFFIGYIGVEILGKPDMLIASILFGGSIFVFAMLHLIRTVTKRIQENDKLKSDLKAAEKANVSKTVFLSSVSHDIRTPLNAIIGYTKLAKRDEMSLEEAKTYLSKIERSGLQLQELIDDILEMSRIESGKITVNEEPEDILSIMDDVRDIFSVQMKEKNMAFSVDASSVENRFTVCDRTLIGRVLLNLVSNSYKYTEEGGRIKVTLSEKPSKSDEKAIYEFCVSDNGMGMTKEFAAKVFDAFEREQTSTISGIQGTGLGMAITKNIVDMMDGDISIITSPGQGTEIMVTLELKKCEKEDVQSTVRIDDRNDIDFNGFKVLLVDDVEVNREIAVMLLEDKGFQVDVAVNGKDAFEKIAKSAPGDYNVILMDVQMPVMDGYEASRKIRELDDPYLSNIPIVALTANAFEEDRKRALEAGMNGHIAKPIDPDAMIKTLYDIIKA